MKLFLIPFMFLLMFLTSCSTSTTTMNKITKDYEKTTTFGDYQLGVDGKEAYIERQMPALEYYFALLRENDFLIAKVKSSYLRIVQCNSKSPIPTPKIPKRTLTNQEIGFDDEKDVIIISRDHINTAIKSERDIRTILEMDLTNYLSLERETDCSKKNVEIPKQADTIIENTQ